MLLLMPLLLLLMSLLNVKLSTSWLPTCKKLQCILIVFHFYFHWFDLVDASFEMKVAF